jgi:UPF0716 protein FxsA
MRNKPYSLYLIALVIIILILESVLFVVAFKWLGIWPILTWVIGAAMVGGYLLYQQYFQMEQIRAELKAAFTEEDAIKPTEVVFKKLIFPFIGAWLLILPGFITDLLAVICFLPFLPRLMGRWITLKPRREVEPDHSSSPPSRPSSRPTRKGKQKRKR